MDRPRCREQLLCIEDVIGVCMKLRQFIVLSTISSKSKFYGYFHVFIYFIHAFMITCIFGPLYYSIFRPFWPFSDARNAKAEDIREDATAKQNALS